MKCSFCDVLLVCKHCGKPYQPGQPESHQAVYQPDMEIHCPACQELLICKACNYAYGEPDEPEEPA
jgi:hypothetical protein